MTRNLLTELVRMAIPRPVMTLTRQFLRVDVAEVKK
jgi:hypothetical protein